MKIVNLYSPFYDLFFDKKNVRSALKATLAHKNLLNMAKSWEIDLDNVQRWMVTPEYQSQHELALKFIELAPKVVAKVEKVFGTELKGELRLSPSLMRFDGFARYDSGSHSVWFGVDHPDADEDYLKVLLAHELSHVYRDHQPRVWGFLKKPLEKISRQEYLDNMSAMEHLASEGLATLFSQQMFPEVPIHVHHYYFEEEMRWCLENVEKIDKAITECMAGDQEIWSFYNEGKIEGVSPSRVQYFWAARRIANWIHKGGSKFKSGGKSNEALIEVHGWPSAEFDCLETNS